MERSCVVEFVYLEGIPGCNCKGQPSADVIGAIKDMLESNTSLRVLTLDGFRDLSVFAPKVSTAEWEALFKAAKGRPEGFELNLMTDAVAVAIFALWPLPCIFLSCVLPGLPSVCCTEARLWSPSQRTGASTNYPWFCPCIESSRTKCAGSLMPPKQIK